MSKELNKAIKKIDNGTLPEDQKSLMDDKIDLDEQEMEAVVEKGESKKTTITISNKPDYDKSHNRFLLNESNHTRDHAKKRVQVYKKMKKLLSFSSSSKNASTIIDELPYIYRATDLGVKYSIVEGHVEFVEEVSTAKRRG